MVLVALVVAEVGWSRASAARKTRARPSSPRSSSRSGPLAPRRPRPTSTSRRGCAPCATSSPRRTRRTPSSPPGSAGRTRATPAARSASGRSSDTGRRASPAPRCWASPSDPAPTSTVGLTEAIRVELELLREEVGTHAELATLELGEGVDAHEALTILRVVQELTVDAREAGRRAPGARRHARTATPTVRVVALGWTDSPPNASAFESGLAALDGTLDLPAGPRHRRHPARRRTARHPGRRLTDGRRTRNEKDATMGDQADRRRIEELIAAVPGGPARSTSASPTATPARPTACTTRTAAKERLDDGVERLVRAPGQARPRRRPTAWSSPSRRSTPPARTAPSST